MSKRILDCYASDFAHFTKKDLLESIRKSEGRVLACETIGTVQPMLGNVTNAECVSAMGADIVLLNMFDVQKPAIRGLPETEPENVVRLLKKLTGRPVELVQGDYTNIKITTREDLPRKENGGKTMRIGHGYDVHRLVEGRKLILGGVEVPYEKGLLGHSDADVLAHAVMDAVLGAAALGDIGKHFPDTAAEYAGADSLVLARRVAEILHENGWKIENIDSTILCQKPKLASYIPAMREKLAEAFGLPVDAVSVKATTEEHLGFTGEGLGIAAHAVALIDKL